MSEKLSSSLSEELENEIIKLYKEGYSQKNIKEHLGHLEISLKRIRETLLSNGFCTHNYRAVSEVTKNIIELLIYEGYSYQKISSILDVSFHVIRELSENRNLDIGKKRREKCDFEILKEERFCLDKDLNLSYYDSFVKEYENGSSFLFLYDKYSMGIQDVCPLVSRIADKQDLIDLHEKNLKKCIDSMLTDGLPVYMIAKKLHVSLSIVRKEKKHRMVS